MTGNGGPPSVRQAIVADAAVLDGRRALGLAAVSGALLATAFPIVDWGPIAWIALVPLLLAALGRGLGSAFRAGWLGGLRVLPRDALLAGADHRHLYEPLATRERRSAGAAVRFSRARLRHRDGWVRVGASRRRGARAGSASALGLGRMDSDLHPRRLSMGEPRLLAVSRHLSRAVRRDHRHLRVSRR